jgi:hypothetical protein
MAVPQRREQQLYFVLAFLIPSSKGQPTHQRNTSPSPAFAAERLCFADLLDDPHEGVQPACEANVNDAQRRRMRMLTLRSRNFSNLNISFWR